MNFHHTKNSPGSGCHSGLYPRLFAGRFTAVALLLSLSGLGSLLLPVDIQAATTSKRIATQATEIDEDARWFQVELILFSQQTDAALDAEQWSELNGVSLPDHMLELSLAPPAPATSNAARETEAGTPTDFGIDLDINPGIDLDIAELNSDFPTAFQILADDELQLTDLAQRIRRSSQRELLLHIAWQQPTYERKHAEPIYFVANMAEPLPVAETSLAQKETLPETALATENLLSPLVEYATEEDTNIGPRGPQFVGTVTLSVERYLHLAANLVYRRPVTQHTAIPIPDLDLWYDRPYPTLREPQGPAFRQMNWQAIRGFRLKESRRMRSTVIHYLDHPFMGLVVVITRVELPEPAEEIQQTSPQNILTTPGKR